MSDRVQVLANECSVFAVTFSQRIQGLDPFGNDALLILHLLLSLLSGWPNQRHSQPQCERAQDKKIYTQGRNNIKAKFAA